MESPNSIINFGQPLSGLPLYFTFFPTRGAPMRWISFKNNQLNDLMTLVSAGRIGITEIEDTLKFDHGNEQLEVMLFPEVSFKLSIQNLVIQISWIGIGGIEKSLHFDLEKGKGILQRAENSLVELWYERAMLVPSQSQ